MTGLPVCEFCRVEMRVWVGARDGEPSVELTCENCGRQFEAPDIDTAEQFMSEVYANETQNGEIDPD